MKCSLVVAIALALTGLGSAQSAKPQGTPAASLNPWAGCPTNAGANLYVSVLEIPLGADTNTALRSLCVHFSIRAAPDFMARLEHADVWQIGTDGTLVSHQGKVVSESEQHGPYQRAGQVIDVLTAQAFSVCRTVPITEGQVVRTSAVVERTFPVQGSNDPWLTLALTCGNYTLSVLSAHGTGLANEIVVQVDRSVQKGH